MGVIKIRNIKTILTAPANVDLVVVKVETTEPELYGLGCATFTQRYAAVATVIEEYLKPLLIGRDVQNIEDIWQVCAGSSYWRNGPVLNNAISGIDEALWDIKGKLANMPVYQLLGGKCREGAVVYRHAKGNNQEELDADIRRFMAEGYRYVRCDIKGNKTDETTIIPEGAPCGAYYDPELYMRRTVESFRHLHDTFAGENIHFLCDVHERLTPNQAIQLAKQLEETDLFFLEDALPLEQLQWMEKLRQQTTIPLAIGELFNHPLEWRDLVSKQLIDYIRVHISQIGGVTPARKLAAFCEAYGVRTAWHGPHDISPVGVAAQLHLDLSIPNFGIQEFFGFSEIEQEVFPGCPEVRNGYLYANDKPGWGVDIDEEKAKQYPCKFREHAHDWLQARLPDGTAVRA